MKITGLQIYGYGKLVDLEISDMQELQVIYGENEAGKSTIMSFIHSILFGFPTKLQTERTYEPKKGSKFGGKLTVDFPEKGRVVIERVKGKATGDVTVLLDDGTTGDEELLKELLQQVDKSLFQSIFSFNLHGLQNIHQMKGEDIGKFLFSAGALGTDKLTRAENMLQKELESRFKPNGRKPVLNEMLKELNQLQKELKSAEQQNEQYWSLLKEKEKLEGEIANKQAEQAQLHNRNLKLEAWRSMQPLKIEEQALMEELTNIGDLQFPIDGISRFERLEELMKPLEGQLSSINSRLNGLQNEIKNQSVNTQILLKEQEILSAIDNLSLLERLQAEEREQLDKQAQMNEEETILREKLYLSIDEDSVTSVNTSVFMKERIVAAEENYRRVQAKKLELDEKFNEEKQELEEIEKSINAFEKRLLSEKDRKDLEEKLHAAGNKHELEAALNETEERRKQLHKTLVNHEKKDRQKIKQERVQYTFLSLLFLFLLAWGVVQYSWPIITLGAIGILFSLYLLTKKPAKADVDFIKEEIAEIEDREKLLLQKIKAPIWHDDHFIEEKLQVDDDILAELSQLKMRWKESNRQYEKVIMDYEAWEMAKLKAEKEMIELGKGLYLPQDVAFAYLTEAFRLIEQLKKLYRERKAAVERQQLLTSKITAITQAIEILSKECLGQPFSNVQEAAFMLRSRLKEETENQILLAGKKAKHTELAEDRRKYQLEWQHFQEEKEQLFQLANAIHEEWFRELGKLDEKKRNLEEQLQQLQKQLNLFSIQEAEMEDFKTVQNLDELSYSLNEKLESIKETIPSLQSRLAEVYYKIQLLEEGGTYTELLHLFKLKKTELESAAKEWAKYALAKEILDRTIERFKQARLPKMLEKAEEYLLFLTDGAYVRIYPKKEGSGFLLEKKDQFIFEANELSQATAEQVYVSLRLALAVTIYEKFAFPIIIDDSFVNFDYKRTEKVIQLLKSLTGRQILFFTCQKHMLNYFQEEQVLVIGQEISESIMSKESSYLKLQTNL
ncbi:AAA family ATPase [Cytobacillus depressus]|uniref:AAA family ATPase n=1 Tax=Cytobacillus depressus TaxID=1602942 RepID=A0A6L3V6P6_9BACI|nr:AAA family ATPase [Cytobacillus depressus]KAB2337124.1 AAA family ATPase [Cytobacillus depressus]